jgi:IclR family acetate operon transcriptional repressor
MGKAILAWLPVEELEALLVPRGLPRLTPNTIARKAHLLQHLKQVREQGYSVDLEEIEEGLRCVGAPVRDHTGRVVAAVSVSGPRHRFSTEAIVELARLVRQSADQISARMGAPPTQDRAGPLLKLPDQAARQLRRASRISSAT